MNLDFAGKKVLVRVDFNVPLDKKTLAITDDTSVCISSLNKMHIVSASTLFMHFVIPSSPAILNIFIMPQLTHKQPISIELKSSKQYSLLCRTGIRLRAFTQRKVMSIFVIPSIA